MGVGIVKNVSRRQYIMTLVVSFFCDSGALHVYCHDILQESGE